MSEIMYLYWLGSIPGIGFKVLTKLRKYVGSALDVYNKSESDLSIVLTERQLTALVNSREKWDISGEYAKLGEKGIEFYPYGYAGYPEKLLTLSNPPAALYVKGRLPDPRTPAVAVIGTRKCSGYGSAMAKQLGTKLAERGVAVISGMARGIDGIGQRAVCEANGATFALLGCGVDIIYPPENKWLYERIIENGGIISEYAPGTEPNAGLFPARNRLISGLSDAVVVVEAKDKSGTMITVDMALEQGREVYAMPGRLVDGHSCGCNRLIKQGAGLITSIDEFVDDILLSSKTKLVGEVREMKTETKKKYEKTSKETSHEEKIFSIEKKLKAKLTNEEYKIYTSLDYIPRSLEQISTLNPHISYETILKTLVLLCIKGCATQMGAGSYCLSDNIINKTS